MRRILIVLLVLTGMARAGTTTVNSSMSVATINSMAATAAASTGNLVQFTPGTYPAGAYNLPCTNGVIYQGVAIAQPNISNLPSVIIPGRGAGSYSFNIPSNGTGNTSYTAGCQFHYFQFSGAGGAFYLNYPFSGINIQYNYFTLNDGTPSCTGACAGTPPGSEYSGGSSTAVPTIFLSGNCGGSGAPKVTCTSSLGTSYVQVDSNTYYNNCRNVRNAVFNGVSYDAGGTCVFVWTQGWSFKSNLNNNIINGTEEGMKWNETYFQTTGVMNSISVQNNQCQNNSRICFESQQNSDGNAIFSHNATINPGGNLNYGPGFPTFEFSIPINSASPAMTMNDNVVAAGAASTSSGFHYGIGFEVWGQGATGQYNLFLNSNTCGSAFWLIEMGGNNAGQNWTNNYFSGCNTWNGSANNVGNAFTLEDGATFPNATINPNTVVQTSVNLATATPTISPSSGTGSQTVTLADSDSAHRNVTIFYTTDGTTPAPFVFGGSAGTTQVYSGPFSVAGGTTVKAVALWGTGANQGLTYGSYFGWIPSGVTTVTYSGSGPPTAATPVLAPTSQTFTGSLNVSMSDSTTGSSIYYTTDGATPVAGPGGAIIGTQYYISPAGSDSNNGTSVSTPWLSPNHAVNCGDVLNAAAGTYSTINFTSGKWGTVTCTSGNNVAWLKCTTFDTCKISSTTADAMWVDKSFWGVQGWEASTNGSSNNEAACFRATPSGAYILHHLVFANNIANGCQGGGFISYNTSTTAGTDYLTLVGNIAYNAAQGAGECFSGFSMYQPLNFDTVAGTHLFMGGNFAFGNIDPATCAGGPPTDGEGFNFDTLDHSQGGGAVYTGQAVAENNISVFNGGKGFEAENSNAGSTHAPIFFKNNTSFGNSTDPNQTTGCFDRGELNQQNAQNVTWTNNLAQTRNGTSCSGEPLYGFTALPPATGSIINGSWWLGISGHNTDPNTPSFVLGTGNTIGTNPTFTNPIQPPAPACSGTASVPACMASVIDNYIPIAPASTTLGYQTPSPDAVNDPLFPQWLCNVNLPPGLISSACSPIYTGPLTLSTTTTVQAIAAAPSFVNSSVASGTYTVSTPILTGGAQTNTPLVNTLTVGAPAVQQFAVGNYSDEVNRNLPDGFGNTPVWTSSAPTILQVTGAGLISCLAPGTANSQVKSAPGGIVFNVWGWTCNAATSTVATPVFTPGTENFSGTLSVSISTTTAGATIHYTTDGSTPTATSPTYTGPLSIVATTVVRALGVLSGDNPSAVATATYTQVAATISQITLSIVGSTFVNYVLVGGTAHFQANIQYSDGVILPSTTVGVNNARGDSISSWTTSSSMVGTISTGGVFTGASLGSATIQAVINGTLNSSNWVEYVSKSITTNVAGATIRGVNIQ